MWYDPFRYAAYHLFKAKRWKDLYGLVQDVRWYRDSHAHDPNGVLYAHDVELAYQAAMNAGIEGLATLASLSLIASQATSSAFARLPLEGLECWVRLDPSSADMIVEHISQTLAQSEQPEAYLAIASALCAAGKTDKAYTLARRALAIPVAEPVVKALIFARAGEILAQIGGQDEAARLASMASIALWSVPIWWESHIHVNAAVWSLFARLGCWEQAQISLRSVMEHMGEVKTCEGTLERMSDLLVMGLALHYARELDWANECIESAVRTIVKKSAPPRWPWSEWEHKHTCLLAKAMQVLVSIGRKERAHGLKAQLLSSARFFTKSRIEDTTHKIAVLCSAALALVHLGDHRSAESFLKQAVDLAQSAPIDSMITLEDAAGFVLESVLRIDLLRPRRHLAFLLAPYRVRFLALTELVKALAQAGARHTAHQAFSELLSEASQAQARESFLARLESDLLGPHQTRSGFFFVFILKAMIESCNPDLGDMVLTFFKRQGVLHSKWELTYTAAIYSVSVGQFRLAAAILRECPLIQLSRPVVQTVLEELAYVGDLEGAVELVNKGGRAITGCGLVAIWTSVVPTLALLFLLAFHDDLRWIRVGILTVGTLFVGGIGFLTARRKDKDGITWAARFAGRENALPAMVKGLVRSGKLNLACRIARKVGENYARALAMIQIAEAAALAEDNTLFRTAIDEAMRVLTQGTLEQKERADLLIALSAAAQCLGTNYALQLEGALWSGLKLASEIKKAPLRASALAAVASSLLFLDGKHEAADRALQEVLASARVHWEIRDEVIQRLGKANDVGTLQRLWKLGFAADYEHEVVKALMKASLQRGNVKGFCDLVPALRRLPDWAVALSRSDYLDMLRQATGMLKSVSTQTETKTALREACIIIAEDIMAYDEGNPDGMMSVLSLAQLGHELGLDSEMLEILQLHLAALKKRTAGSEVLDLGSVIEAYGKAAQALSELELPEAKRLSIDVLHAMFGIARASGRQEYAWYTIWQAIPTLAQLGGQKVLTEAWKSIRQSESAANSMQAERATINNYQALLG